MRISDWSSDVCSSDLENPLRRRQWTAKGTNRKQTSTLAGTPERRATLARGAEAVRRTTRLRENAVQTCRLSGSPPSARHTLSARRTTATGSSPGSPVNAGSDRPPIGIESGREGVGHYGYFWVVAVPLKKTT